MKLLLFELANFQPPVVEVDRGTQVPYDVVYVPHCNIHVCTQCTDTFTLYCLSKSSIHDMEAEEQTFV